MLFRVQHGLVDINTDVNQPNDSHTVGYFICFIGHHSFTVTDNLRRLLSLQWKKKDTFQLSISIVRLEDKRNTMTMTHMYQKHRVKLFHTI